MGAMIHCRVIDGEKRYRVWSTIVDDYLTDPMTEEEMHEYEIESAIQHARESAEREWPRRLERAQTRGTSSMMGDSYPLDGPWKEPIR